ncbi:hypothetical protein ACFSL6_27930 [Paenibacillus thailandensis]|uniref:Uncharacterized protein n=1 Tax=Paenibacillus thailandensis TaxID=393250 RepID=A0ABW5R3Q3_9BACL
MTEILIIAILLAAILLFAFSQRKNRGGSSPASVNPKKGGARSAASGWPGKQPPEALGVPLGHPARPAAERLEAAISPDFEERIRDRVTKAWPNLRRDEWNWTWFELKRYFLLCGIVKSVPMYSKNADRIWHEMLMFTREYEDWCKRYCGEMIHHSPHPPGFEPKPEERAWFDWLYGELFEYMPSSRNVWGAFYRTPLSAERIDRINRMNRSELRALWFNAAAGDRYPDDIGRTIDYLLNRLEMQLQGALRKEDPDDGNRRQTGSDGDLFTAGVLSGMFFHYSVVEPDRLEDHLREQRKEEEDKADRNGYGASDGGAGYAGGNGDWDRRDDDLHRSGHHGHDGRSDHDHGGGQESHGGHGGNDGGSSSGGSDGGGSSCGGGGCSS